MSILGYDPARFHTGRAPIEAAALGLRLGPDQVAYRCNLVTVGADGTMEDFAGGHPSTEQAAEVIAALDAELGGDGIEFHPGVQYRHIMVAPADLAESDCVPPHDLTGKPSVLPSGPAARRLVELMEASKSIVGATDLGANQIWLWGQGFQPAMANFTERFGVTAGLVTAVDLVRGLGVLTGITVHDLATATGWYDTDYAGKRNLALQTLREGTDLFVIHVEATDEAGHAGNTVEKVRALENWDREILGPLVEGLDGMGAWRLLLLPDHATPLALRTHTSDPVPWLLVDSAVDGPGGVYTEAGVADADVVAGHRLMDELLSVR
jgi:2,3-bisphosphoglycerate-independent phosphoglycerate mutase